MEAVLRHILALLGAAWLVTVPFAAPADGQEEEFPNPLEVLLDAFEQPEGQEFVARFAIQPRPGAGSIDDGLGDFEHSTGQEPGFTPDHLDITRTWALELDPGPVDLLTPTDAGRIWAGTGRLEIDPPDHEPFQTFTGEQVHDGSQYERGALLFGFTLRATPPIDPPGRCEYVVWITDLERGDTFVANPNFPLDPAAGTNIAFGLALNPSDGPGIPSGFAIELQESGGFAPIFEADIRAFMTPGHVGILVPSEMVGELASANFYSFCAEEGFDFEPQVSGADQTGLVDLSADDLGVVQFETRSIPSESTTTTTTEATTTTPATTTTEPPPETTIPGPDDANDEFDGFSWWVLLIVGGVGLALAGWWLYSRPLGLGLIIGGAAIAITGLVAWAVSDDERPATSTTTTTPSTTTVEPSTTTSTVTVTTTSTTVPPTTTTTIDARPAIESFVAAFTDAIDQGDTDFLLDTLHPAVISLFGAESCRAFISGEILQLEQYRLIGEITGPTTQVIADMTVDMYSAPAAFAFQGQEFASEAAFAFVDGDVRWFTQCGG